jgi:hypothetical protein
VDALIEMMTLAQRGDRRSSTRALARRRRRRRDDHRPQREWTIDVEQFASKSRNCPYQGWKLKGRAVATIVGGDVKWELRA